ncbi:hypothetical protein JW905_12810 [bacterium]|nr:hypothetical protein [candidate division CSSED10-310 bacterium]
MRAAGNVLMLLIVAAGLTVVPVNAERVVVLVNNQSPDIYGAIEGRLENFADLVWDRFNVEIEVLPDDYYNSFTAADVRTLLQAEYDEPDALTGAILAGTIPYATYRHGDGCINPAPLYFEDFEAQWVDANPVDGHFEDIITDAWNNPTEIWTAWWIPPNMGVDHHADYLMAYLMKLDGYYHGWIEGSDAMLFAGSDMTNLTMNDQWIELLMDSGGRSAEDIMAFGVHSSDQDPMWGYGGVAQWVYPNDLTKPRMWNGSTWFGFNSALDATIYESPVPGAGDVLVEELVHLFNENRFKYCHFFSHGSPEGIYFHGMGNYFLYSDVGQITYGGANIITTSGCNNGNFRGSVNAAVAYDHCLGSNLIFDSDNACVTWYGSASSQSTGLFADYHQLLIQGLRPEPGNYFAKGYYAMRNSDIVWGSSHYFFRSVDDKILLGNPFVTWYDVALPSPTPSPTPRPTPDPSFLYLNAIYLVQHNNAGQGANRYYQDTIISNPVPSSGWDGGKMDLGVIAGFYDLGSGLACAGGQIDPADVIDLGGGTPAWEARGDIAGTPVMELPGAVPLMNRPSTDTTPVTASTHAGYINASGMRKTAFCHQLMPGVYRWTLLAPSAMELQQTGLLGLFISHDDSLEGFAVGAAPMLAVLDDQVSGGATADAGGQYVPGYPGFLDAEYFQPSTCLLASDSRTAELPPFRVTVTYFNMAGSVQAVTGHPNGITGHAAPGWIAGGGIGYNSIDGQTGDALAYLELSVEYMWTPTPVLTPTPSPTGTPVPAELPTLSAWGIFLSCLLLGLQLIATVRRRG